MKTYFADPELKVIQFDLKDVLSSSLDGLDDDELPPRPIGGN